MGVWVRRVRSYKTVIIVRWENKRERHNKTKTHLIYIYIKAYIHTYIQTNIHNKFVRSERGLGGGSAMKLYQCNNYSVAHSEVDDDEE